MNIQAALVRSILEKWKSYEWTMQGFGFIRTKIANVGRIHVWDSSLAVKRVSTLHTHPWPLRSTIISGELINQRFDSQKGRFRYMQQSLKTGEGGGLVGEPTLVLLRSEAPEVYGPGDVYEQAPEERHRTIAQDGTVTLIERPQGPPLEEALTYWPEGTAWVSAEPQKVPDWMAQSVIDYALARWYAGVAPDELVAPEGK